METFTLVIATAVIGGWFTPHEELVHLPKYTRHECEKLAAAVPPPRAAKCVQEPPRPRMPVICPFFPPCWRDGRPVDAVGNPSSIEETAALIDSRTR
jgi:hypothetical protein